jgi:hypothetical protein
MNLNKLVKCSRGNLYLVIKFYIKCLAISYVSSIINVKIKVRIQDISKLIVKTRENAIRIVWVLPYLCMRPYSAPVESGVTGGWKY